LLGIGEVERFSVDMLDFPTAFHIVGRITVGEATVVLLSTIGREMLSIEFAS
jgi:hypothetical protein